MAQRLQTVTSQGSSTGLLELETAMDLADDISTCCSNNVEEHQKCRLVIVQLPGMNARLKPWAAGPKAKAWNVPNH